MKLHRILILSLLFVSSIAFAQNKTVKGTVTFGKAPIKGVKVSVQGTQVSVLTDDKGQYSIDLPPTQNTLIIVGEGLVSQYISIKKKISSLDIRVELSDQDKAIAAGLIKPEVLNSQSTMSYNDSNGNLSMKNIIEGKAPGVVYENGYVIIRGQQCEYYAIDGSPIDNLLSINPADVDEVKVVKDGTSNIYGAKARNGAVLITTKGNKK